MVRILETAVNLEYALGHHLHCLVAQLPVRLRHGPSGWAIAEPDAQWRLVRSVLDLVAEGEKNLKKLHFLLLPEAAVPLARLDEALELVAARFRPNTVTAFGLEHVPLHVYRDLLERFERRPPATRLRVSSLEPMEAGSALVDLIATSRVVAGPGRMDAGRSAW